MEESGGMYARGADRCEAGGLLPGSSPPYIVRSAQPLPCPHAACQVSTFVLCALHMAP